MRATHDIQTGDRTLAASAPGTYPPPRLIITRTGPDAPLDVLPLWVEGPLPGRARGIRPIRVAILWGAAAALGALALIAG